jgi:hypothetical protein
MRRAASGFDFSNHKLEKNGHTGGSEAETVRQPRDRLKGQPQEGQHSAAAGGARDRLPPARGAVFASGMEAGWRRKRSVSVHDSPTPIGETPKTLLSVSLVPAFNCDHPQCVIKHFENYSIVTDAKAILVGTGERFGERERVRLRGVKTHFCADAPSIQRSQTVELFFRRRREDKFHNYKLWRPKSSSIDTPSPRNAS